MVERSVVLWWK